MFGPVLLTFVVYLASGLSAMIGPCKRKDDFECYTKAVNQLFIIVNDGIPSLGIESLDPMFYEVIEGDLLFIQLKLVNTTIKGFKDCTVNNVNVDFDAMKANHNVDCPSLSISGLYEVRGGLIEIPVEEKGPYDIVTSRYSVDVELDFEINNENNGKSYMNITDFKTREKVRGPIKLDIRNLSNSHLSDALHALARENWKTLVDWVQEPILKQIFKRIVISHSKFMNSQPLEEIFVN